jgi:hypothetical protein
MGQIYSDDEKYAQSFYFGCLLLKLSSGVTGAMRTGKALTNR